MILAQPHNLVRHVAAAQDARACDDAQAVLDLIDQAMKECREWLEDGFAHGVMLPYYPGLPDTSPKSEAIHLDTVRSGLFRRLDAFAQEIGTFGGYSFNETARECIPDWVAERNLTAAMSEIDDFFHPARDDADREIEEHAEVFDPRREWGTTW